MLCLFSFELLRFGQERTGDYIANTVHGLCQLLVAKLGYEATAELALLLFDFISRLARCDITNSGV